MATGRSVDVTQLGICRAFNVSVRDRYVTRVTVYLRYACTHALQAEANTKRQQKERKRGKENSGTMERAELHARDQQENVEKYRTEKMRVTDLYGRGFREST